MWSKIFRRIYLLFLGQGIVAVATFLWTARGGIGGVWERAVLWIARPELDKVICMDQLKFYETSISDSKCFARLLASFGSKI